MIPSAFDPMPRFRPRSPFTWVEEQMLGKAISSFFLTPWNFNGRDAYGRYREECVRIDVRAVSLRTFYRYLSRYRSVLKSEPHSCQITKKEVSS